MGFQSKNYSDTSTKQQIWRASCEHCVLNEFIYLLVIQPQWLLGPVQLGVVQSTVAMDLLCTILNAMDSATSSSDASAVNSHLQTTACLIYSATHSSERSHQTERYQDPTVQLQWSR